MAGKGSSRRLIVEPEPVSKLGRAERTRAEIMNAALEFIWSHPFRELSVNALMDSLPLGRTVFYKHFESIDALMVALLRVLEGEISAGISPWLEEDGDPVALIFQSLAAEVRVCYRNGPLFSASADAAASYEDVHEEWKGFLDRFDQAVVDRIVIDQSLGLIDAFDPAPVAKALNLLDAGLYTSEFGARPRKQPGPVLDAIARVWISTLYGPQWVARRSSNLVRINPG